MLIVCGILSIIGGVIQLASNAHIAKNGYPPAMREFMPDPEMVKVSLAIGNFLAILGMLAGPVMIAGGIAMLTRRMYAVAYAGSICALIPLNAFCCCICYFIGLAAGIYGISALNDPQVKACF